ncbi:MAG: 3-hydroxyacyl-CoA dehydrogenase [Pseudomonadota bacterium]
MEQTSHHKVAIIGAGSIGVAFALVFARAGWQVRLQDPDALRRAAAPGELLGRLHMLQSFDLLAEVPSVITARVTAVSTLDAAVANATLVFECAPEQVEIKRQLFQQLDRAAPTEAILCSASSALTASSFCGDLPGRGRCLVAHPGNPPYLIPVIELVPAPFTAPGVVDRCRTLLAEAGMRPVTVRREIEGFIFNRLQGAVLREAYCLVRDGIASVEDIDTVMRDGLGLRWSVMGPFETVDLNTRGGISSHAEKMGPAYTRMGAQRGQDDPWTPALVAQVAAERRALLPLEDWARRVEWRDARLMTLARLQRQLAQAAE